MSKPKIPLVMLPGLSCDEQLFAPQVSYFKNTRPVQVERVDSSNTIEGIAEKILQSTPELFALAGLSLGGIVALEVMRQAPDRVVRLGLFDTNPGKEPESYRPTRKKYIDRIERDGLEQLRALVGGAFYSRYVAKSRLHDEVLKAQVTEMAARVGVAAFIRQSQALLERADSWDLLASIDCPTLVLCGDQDQLCTPQIHQDMAGRIRNATLSVVPDCGHLSTLEQPEEVNQAMQLWLGDGEL